MIEDIKGVQTQRGIVLRVRENGEWRPIVTEGESEYIPGVVDKVAGVVILLSMIGVAALIMYALGTM